MSIGFKYKILLSFVVVSCGLLVSGRVAWAAPEFMVSWKANGYAPEWYTGKVLPSDEALVSAAFNIIDGGKIVDISKKAVRWYANGDLIKNENDGLGKSKVTFLAKDFGRKETEIRIVLPDYAGKEISKSITLPIRQPEVVLESASYNNMFSKSEEAVIYAWPFFFNIRDLNALNIKWTINGSEASNVSSDRFSFPIKTDKDMKSGEKFTISIDARNKNKITEVGQKMRIFEIK